MSEYVFDSTGQLVDNLIVNEQHVLTDLNYKDYYFIIPLKAPFFTNNLKVKLVTLVDERLLVENVDYSLSLPNMSATRSIGIPIYSGISFHNQYRNGIVVLEYQTIGGIWTGGRDHAVSVITANLYNPRTTYWDVVTDKNTEFPPINHNQHLDSIVGHKELIEGIDRVVKVISEIDGNKTAIKHLLDHDNPHNLTAHQLGLGNISNFRIADITESLEGIREDLYLTPLGMNAKFNEFSSAFLDRLLDETISIFRNYNDSTNSELDGNLRILFNDYAQTQREFFQVHTSEIETKFSKRVLQVEDELVRVRDDELRLIKERLVSLEQI